MARRVYADSIAIIFAAREPAPHPGVLDGLPELRIDGLPEADARELLASAAGRLDHLAAGRIVAETGGNPLALIEIGQEIAAGQLASQLRGLDAAAPLLRQAIDAVRHEAGDPPEMFQWLAAACADATILADEPRLRELTRRMEAAAREQGAMVPLSLALSYAGVSGLLAGDLPEAERCFTEITAIAEARGQPWGVGSLILSAWRGQADRAYALLEVVAEEADRQGQGYQLVFADYARCILELGEGHYDAAYASFGSCVDDTSQVKFVLPDLVEAAQRSGHPDAADGMVRLLAKLAAGQPGPVTLGFLARAQALVAGDDAEAEDHYREAINQHGRAQAHLARSHLVYGEWLRRVKRPRDARSSLRTAHRLFDDIGAQGFARRARLELAAAGETVRRSGLRRARLRPHPAGSPSGPARGRRRDQRGDRRAALPQPQHHRLPPPEGVPEARRHLPPSARPRAARSRSVTSISFGNLDLVR